MVKSSRIKGPPISISHERSANGELSSQDVDRAAMTLLGASHGGALLQGLPSDIRPGSRADGYRIQTRVAELHESDMVGWKIAATSAAGQRHINVGGPLLGRIPADRRYFDQDAVSLRQNSMRLAEVEFAFTVGAHLPPRETPYTSEEVMDATSGLRLCIELPGSRFADVTTVGEEQLIADNACAHDFVYGPAAPDLWRDLDLAGCTVEVLVDGPTGQRKASGIGANVLGSPLRALQWSINELSSHGFTLDVGHFVTTGTCCAPIAVFPGDNLIADFGELGNVGCAFSV